MLSSQWLLLTGCGDAERRGGGTWNAHRALGHQVFPYPSHQEALGHASSWAPWKHHAELKKSQKTVIVSFHGYEESSAEQANL